ncbi:MAG: NfeD family protein [Planctomycetota bacterium]
MSPVLLLRAAADSAEVDTTLPIVLLGIGLVLVLAEVFVPASGLIAAAAAVSIVASLVLAFLEGTRVGMSFLVATAVLLPLTLALAFWVFPRSPFGRRVINPGLSFEGRGATDDRDLGLVGRAGETITPLRPAGHARIDGRRVDVVSRGESIEPGEAVVVVEVRGNRVVVARVSDAPPVAGS